MKNNLLRTSALVGALLFMLSSVSIYAVTEKGAINTSGSVYKYIDVYSDDKVENSQEVNASITDPVQIEKLKNLGFTEDEISTFSVSEYEKYKDLNGTLVSKTNKYYRVKKNSIIEVTKLQAEREVKAYNQEKALKLATSGSYSINSGGTDTENTSWLSMTTTISDLGGKHFAFKNSFRWLSLPLCVFTDVVGMTHSSSISIDQGSEYLRYTYDVYIDKNYTSFLRTDSAYNMTADKKNSSGYAFEYDLIGYTSDGYYASNNRGYMVYTGVATPTNFVGKAHAYGHYSHQQLAAPISIDLVSGNLSCSPSLAFDEATDTDAEFNIG